MSHQVVITFDLDENEVQKNAEQEAGRQIAKAIIKEAFGDTYIGSYGAKRNALNVIREELETLLQQNKEEIIDRAVKELSQTLLRSKMVKEKLQEELNGKEGP